ncbi:MAG: YceI family protein [Bacteroidota bacterium]
MKKLIFIAASAVALLAFKPVENTTWSLDKAHAKLGFTVTHLAVSEVEGWFKKFDATVTSSKDDFSDAIVEMSADVNSINTENDQRDTHLKSPDFFDAAKFGTLTFKSKSFKKVKDNLYKITGDLTMHGVTKSVELDAIARTGVHPMTKKNIAGFKISGTLKRSDFAIGASMPTAMLSDEIIIIANAEFAKN